MISQFGETLVTQIDTNRSADCKPKKGENAQFMDVIQNIYI